MKFEDFLRVKAQKVSILKIDSEDEFIRWIIRQDSEQIIAYAEEWGEELTKEVRAMVEDECKRK